jgi:transposase
MEISIIGLDLSKSVFQVHGIDEHGAAVLRRRLRRSEVLHFFAGLAPCVVGLEACGSAHHWARELGVLGHEVRMMAPSYVKPYVKRGKKNDATDAAAICEAAQRPGMRFVGVKSAEQQGVLMLHRSRDLLIRQRTMLVNALRGHMAEFGIVAPRGVWNVKALAAAVADPQDDRIPAVARPALAALIGQIAALNEPIRALERAILAWHKESATSRRLATVPGIGPFAASAIAATVGDPGQFRCGRHFAAWLGLVPRQHSTAGKPRLGRISKMGDRYIRRLLVIGATTRLRYARKPGAADAEWIGRLLARRPARLVTVALANKMARIAWAVMAHGEAYYPARRGIRTMHRAA